MKNVIFFFSGTGNTEWAAKKVARSIGECEIISIADYNLTEKITAERVGIFFPVYFWGLPEIIKNFASNADIEAKYIFELHTMGGYDGVAVNQLSALLNKKGEKLSASYKIRMPNNFALTSKSNRFTDVYRIPDEKAARKLIIKSGKKLQRFCDDISQMKPHKNADAFFLWHGMGYRLNEEQCKGFHSKGAEFSAALENTCTGCGRCSKVCPVSNIAIVSGKPVWGDKCEFCTACLHACPVKAINYGFSNGKPRYSFPAELDD